MSWPYPIYGIIFDCDGLLLDSERHFATTIKHLTGHELTKDLHLKIMGANGVQCAKIILSEFGIERDPVQFVKDLDAYLNTLLPESDLMPGAEKLLKLFDSINIPMSLASGSSRCNYSAKTAKHKDVMDLIKVTTFGDEVKRGKPDPEIFIQSMHKMGINTPHSCIVFEDSPGGIKAAVDAGFPCVMVPNPDFPYEELLQKYNVRPTFMLKSLEDFNLNMFDFSNFTNNIQL